MREDYRNYQRIEPKKNPKTKPRNKKTFQQTETTQRHNVVSSLTQTSHTIHVHIKKNKIKSKKQNQVHQH